MKRCFYHWLTFHQKVSVAGVKKVWFGVVTLERVACGLNYRGERSPQVHTLSSHNIAVRIEYGRDNRTLTWGMSLPCFD